MKVCNGLKILKNQLIIFLLQKILDKHMRNIKVESMLVFILEEAPTLKFILGAFKSLIQLFLTLEDSFK